MPRYMFDVEDHGHDEDDVGQELADPAQARIEAISYAGAILRDDPEMVWDGREFKVHVREAGGREVCTVIVRAIDAESD